MERFVLFENSSTQRVSVQINDNGDVLISKDWRKTLDSEWMQGKGISLPKQHADDLGELLTCKDNEKLNSLLSKYQSSKEASYHGSTKNPNTGGTEDTYFAGGTELG